jgi:hypothetical protein
MRKLWILIVVAALASVLAAEDLSTIFATGLANTGIGGGVYQFCHALRSFLPVAAMLMVIVAGVIYAGGQMMGAETRARANVWATAALTGALVAVLIAVVAPPVLGTMYGNAANFAC